VFAAPKSGCLCLGANDFCRRCCRETAAVVVVVFHCSGKIKRGVLQKVLAVLSAKKAR